MSVVRSMEWSGYGACQDKWIDIVMHMARLTSERSVGRKYNIIDDL